MKFIAAALAALLPVAAHAQNCKSNITVAVGGIIGFTDLADPANSAALRSCETRLYVHRYAWERVTPEQQKAILGVFKDTGSPIIEVDLPTDADDYFRGSFPNRFLKSGVVAHEAHVDNFFPERPVELWTRFVDDGRKVGLQTISPIWTPNSGQWKKGPFASPLWNNVRAAGAYGGGLSIDAPSDFWFAQEPGYRQFIVDEIRWANEQHLQSTIIVSPGHSGHRFLDLTQKYLAELRAAKVEPSEIIVENYDPRDPPTFLNRVGDDRGRNTISAVALWVARRK